MCSPSASRWCSISLHKSVILNIELESKNKMIRKTHKFSEVIVKAMLIFLKYIKSVGFLGFMCMFLNGFCISVKIDHVFRNPPTVCYSEKKVLLRQTEISKCTWQRQTDQWEVRMNMLTPQSEKVSQLLQHGFVRFCSSGSSPSQCQSVGSWVQRSRPTNFKRQLWQHSQQQNPFLHRISPVVKNTVQLKVWYRPLDAL